MEWCHYRRCQNRLPEGSRSDRRYCRDSHRVMEHTAVKDDRLVAARALLMEQTAAIIDGADKATLDDIAQRAEKLLGK